jgi:hypothetical protein
VFVECGTESRYPKLILHHADKSEMSTLERDVLTANAPDPISVTLGGIITRVTKLQVSNAYLPILETPFPIVILVN